MCLTPPAWSKSLTFLNTITQNHRNTKYYNYCIKVVNCNVALEGHLQHEGQTVKHYSFTMQQYLNISDETLAGLFPLCVVFKRQRNSIILLSSRLFEKFATFDEVSADWQDGVLAVYFRQLATMSSKDRRWLIFDGPVDAIWVETMDTF